MGILAQEPALFETLEYTFPDRHISLWFYIVDKWQGDPWGKEGQPGEWVAVSALDAAAFPPANEPVVARLKTEFLSA